MWKIYVGNLDARVKERELADAFNSYGIVRSVWVARNPPGYAFIEFNSRQEADDAISALDGKHGWRVEMSKRSAGGHKSRSSSSESRCRECGSARHRTIDCRSEAEKRSHRRSSSPRSRTVSARHSSPGRHRRSRSPRHGNSYNDRSDIPRKRERSISPEEDCFRFSRNDLGNSYADECDVTKQHENSMSPDNFCDRSQNDQDDSAEECKVPRKRERNISPELYPSRSPQNDQGTSHADEEWENCKSPEHECSRSPEHEGSRSPKNNHNGSCADELSPAREEHSSSKSPLLDSSPEY